MRIVKLRCARNPSQAVYVNFTNVTMFKQISNDITKIWFAGQQDDTRGATIEVINTPAEIGVLLHGENIFVEQSASSRV